MVVQGEHPSSSDGRVPGYRGTVDSTASGSAGFFLLIKEGNSFVAVPVYDDGAQYMVCIVYGVHGIWCAWLRQMYVYTCTIYLCIHMHDILYT